MRGFERTRRLEHVERAHQVGSRIGVGMVDRIAHARLRCQVYDNVRTQVADCALEQCLVFQYAFDG